MVRKKANQERLLPFSDKPMPMGAVILEFTPKQLKTLAIRIRDSLWNYKLAIGDLAHNVPDHLKRQAAKESLAEIYATLYKSFPVIFNLPSEEFQTLLEEVEQESKQDYIAWLRSMPYDEYLQTPHWKEKRTGALDRANYRCQICNSPSSLNVHHRTYKRRGCELDDDLTVLCRTCHQTFHDNGKLEVER